jgi:Fic family protein
VFRPVIDDDALRPLLDELDRARKQLSAAEVPRLLERWLQRRTEARGAHMSTRIEGNPLTEQQVRETFVRPPADPALPERENLDYREAARFARQAALDWYLDVDGGVIRAFHFLTIRTTDRYGTAGQYRTEQNAVARGREIIYLPPDPTYMPQLMDDLVAWLRRRRRELHPLVLAAIGHVEFINIHPFDDGNGRSGRVLTSYLFMRSGWDLRRFVASEEIFGADVQDYYEQLRRFGRHYPGQEVEMTGWILWFLRRLLLEAEAALRTVTGWASELDSLRRDAARREPALRGIEHLWLAGEITSREYAEAEQVTTPTAVSDLNRLVAAGYAQRLGRGRATRYVALDSPLDHIAEEAREQAEQAVAQLA